MNCAAGIDGDRKASRPLSGIDAVRQLGAFLEAQHSRASGSTRGLDTRRGSRV